ncbi:hypothetical protein GIB67_021107 [Kingdonia uniflora]|uniref:Uncharacterized protein n=1 Tax=Kingdonia uniflora TaxID=39325 RepID=A0A7J7N7S7_9MAGN|nr:hypothetical protein GIB67_021107 [Kingdonia uniflora]
MVVELLELGFVEMGISLQVIGLAFPCDSWLGVFNPIITGGKRTGLASLAPRAVSKRGRTVAKAGTSMSSTVPSNLGARGANSLGESRELQMPPISLWEVSQANHSQRITLDHQCLVFRASPTEWFFGSSEVTELFVEPLSDEKTWKRETNEQRDSKRRVVLHEMGSNKSNLKLSVRKVFISNEFDELLPMYLNFLMGLVDLDTLPLNVSREMLQQHSSLKTIKKKLIRKALDMICRIAEGDPDESSDKEKTDVEASDKDEKKVQTSPSTDTISTSTVQTSTSTIRTSTSTDQISTSTSQTSSSADQISTSTVCTSTSTVQTSTLTDQIFPSPD